MWYALQVDRGVALIEAPRQSITTRRRCTCQLRKHRPLALRHLLLGLWGQNRSVMYLAAGRFAFVKPSCFTVHLRLHRRGTTSGLLSVLRRKVIASVWNVKVMAFLVCRKKFLTLRFVAAKLFAVKTLPYYPARRHFEGSVKREQ